MTDNKSKDKLFSDFRQITKAEWIEKIKTDLKGADYDKKLVWKFDENIRLQPFYMAEDTRVANIPYGKNKKNDWEIREPASIDNITAIPEMLKRGADAITLSGINPADIKSIEMLFETVDLTTVPVHFTEVTSYTALAETLVKTAVKKGIDSKKLKGSFGYDHYGYYLHHGEFYGSEQENIEELKRLTDYCTDNLPLFKITNVDAAIHHNSGANIVSETAFALAQGAEYLTALTDAGTDIEDILSRMQFTFATGSSYFPEIAKIRALRILWNTIASKFNEGKGSTMFIHSVSSSWNKAVYDPYINLLRTTTETMSAIIGGCDAVTVLPLDNFYKNPGEVPQRIARNQQIIMKEEVHLGKVADPAGGSYYIENLTAEIVEKAWDIFLEIENKGGFAKALESGYIFENIEKSARKKDMDIAMRKINILGVNQFPNLKEEMLPEIEKEISAGATGKGLKPYRGAEAFEILRLKTEQHFAAGNKKPVVFLLTYGNLNMRKARANFALNFFGCAGFEVIDNNGFDTVAQGMEAARKASADIIVFCSSDDEYPAMAAEVTNDKEKIVIAGLPPTAEDIKAKGIDKFIHIKSNVLDELAGYQKQVGIK